MPSNYKMGYPFSMFMKYLKNTVFRCYGGTVYKREIYLLLGSTQWLLTTYFAPDPKPTKNMGHGSALKHQRCYHFMRICITRVIRVRDTIEAITAQFQSAASQCPDSLTKRKLCLAFVQVLGDPMQRKKYASQ